MKADSEDHHIVEKFRKLVKQSKPAIIYILNFLANVLNKSIKGIQKNSESICKINKVLNLKMKGDNTSHKDILFKLICDNYKPKTIKAYIRAIKMTEQLKEQRKVHVDESILHLRGFIQDFEVLDSLSYNRILFLERKLQKCQSLLLNGIITNMLAKRKRDSEAKEEEIIDKIEKIRRRTFNAV